MTNQTRLIFTESQEEKKAILWKYIKYGWRVVSAKYRWITGEYEIKLSSEPWPSITIACGGCGKKWAACELLFSPAPGGKGYCVGCQKRR